MAVSAVDLLPERFAGPLPRAAAMPHAVLRLVLVGAMEAWAPGGIAVLPRSRKPRALLAILAMAGGRPVARTLLAATLWSRRGEEQQRGSLRQALHELQEALLPLGEPIITTTREMVTLRAGAVWTDALEIESGRSAPATALCRGGAEFLEDLDGIDPAFDLWLAERRQALAARSLAEASHRLALAEDHAASAEAAQQMLALDPAHRGGWHALIAAEAGRNRRDAALEAYEACLRALAQSGNPPLPETEALVRSLRGAATTAGGGSADQPGVTPAPGASRSAGAARSLLRGAHLGVAPLRILGPGIEAYLAVGLSEEIAAALARFRWMFVADSASLATAAQQHGSEMEAARALGIDLLLTGTLSGSGTRLRITLRLTDLREPASIVWSQHFDRQSHDMLNLQDEVAAEVVARLDPEILLIEANHASARGAETASGYDLLLRAIAAIHRLDREAFVAAGDALREALVLEPDCAAVHAWYAYWYLFLVGQGWAEDTPALIAEAEQHANRAMALDPLDAHGLTVAGHVRAFLKHQVREAAALHERALALNPNLAMAWVFSGMTQSYIGNHADALQRLDRYRHLAPCHPHAFFFDAARGIPLLFLRRHAEAVEVGRNATALQISFSYPYKTYLAALGHLGAEDEAREVRARLLAIEPDFCVEKALRRTPVQRPEDLAHYAEGLRRAGLD